MIGSARFSFANSIRPRTASSHETVPSSGMRKRIAPSSIVRLALGDELLAEAARVVHAVELEVHGPVPVDPEPAQRLLDLLDRLRDLAARVGVLDPQQALAALLPREEPVEEERAHAADVEEAGRARCHADADGHRAYRRCVPWLPRRLLRIEGIAVFAGAIALYFHLGFGWPLLARADPRARSLGARIPRRASSSARSRTTSATRRSGPCCSRSPACSAGRTRSCRSP